MKCIDCKRLNNIQDTEESREGICTYGISWTPVCIDHECIYMPSEELTCKDCERLENDFACMTQEEDDPAITNGSLCPGFIDKDESTIYNILAKWSLKGLDVEGKLKALFEVFDNEFEAPFQPKD